MSAQDSTWRLYLAGFTEIQQTTRAHMLAALLAYTGDYIFAPFYNQIILLTLYLLTSIKALYSNTSSKEFATTTFISLFLAFLISHNHYFAVFLGCRMFIKHVLFPAIGSVDYQYTDRENVVGVVYGPVPLVGYCVTLGVVHGVVSRWVVVLRVLSSHFLVLTLIISLVVWRYILGASLKEGIRTILNFFSALIQRAVAESLDVISVLCSKSIALFDRLETRWIKDKPDTPMASNYHYSEITASRQIRLLKIHQRKPFTNLRCELETVNLDDSPSFQAISYTWLGQSPTGALSVNNQILPVTQGVYEIASYFQSFFGDRYLWIDGTCINQSNLVEKAHQIPLMSEIYRKAWRVILWLGPQEDVKDAHLARRLLCTLSYKKAEYDADKSTFLRNLRKQDPGWRAVVKMLAHPWFSRAWVVQEMSLARNLHVVYGTVCIDWVLLEAGIDMMQEPYIAAFTQVGSEIERYTGCGFMERILNIKNARIMIWIRGEVQAGNEIPLGLLLARCVNFKATDPRDKIFGLLGITWQDLYLGLVPDYSKSVSDVYLETMCYILGSHDPSDIKNAIQFAGVGFPRSKEMEMENLPSWVPDWSASSAWRYFKSNTADRYDPEPPIYVKSSSFDDKRVLGLFAGQFDSIGALTAVCHIAQEASSSQNAVGSLLSIRDWLQEAIDMVKGHRSESDTSPPGKITEDGFWSFLSTSIPDPKLEGNTPENLAHIWKQLNNALSEVSRDLRNTVKNRLLDDEYGLIFKPLSNTEIGGKRFCITEEGRMALVPPLSEEGNPICVVTGLHIPVVLRERKGTEGSSAQPRYEFVGCCLVDDMVGMSVSPDAGYIMIE